jgi:type I restriction enzyme S subunit
LDLLRSQIAFPSEPTRRTIADFLDAQTAQLDRSAKANLLLQARLRERRVAITALGVSGQLVGLTPSKSRVTWLEALPSAWPVVKLTLVARLGSGHTPSRQHPEWWQEGSIPWITTGEVQQMREDRIEYVSETRERISELGMANSAAELHPAETVVLCRTASAGFSAIMSLPMATSQDFVTWTCGALLRPRYLLLCLRAMRQDLLGRLAMGSTHQTIYMPDIESIRVPLPPVEEQDQIVQVTWSKLKKLDELLDHLGHQIELLQERRQALITAAVTGQVPTAGAA